LLDEHATFVREMELELKATADVGHAVPELEPGAKHENDQIPRTSKMQIDLMVNSFVNDFARVATLQYTNSVGGAKMRWLGIDQGHHELSHEPDSKTEAQEKLTKINHWFCEELAYLARRLAETPEPGGPGCMLDNTLIVWTNELGKGNSHTLDDIPFVAVGGGLGWRMGRAIKYRKIPHNRLLLALSYVTVGRRNLARAEFEQLAEANPTNAVYPYWLGRIDYPGGPEIEPADLRHPVESAHPGPPAPGLHPPPPAPV
jgi:hypothetical protein